MNTWRRWVMAGGVAAVCCLLSPLASAAVPNLVRYQGQATDKNGVPLEGTSYTLTLRLYDAETGGAVLWEDTFTQVPITKGHFSVLLGQSKALNADWTKPVWIALQIGSDPELSPRQRITSVPLALVAERLAGEEARFVPTGAIILWSGAGCPSGYTRVSALDGKFLVADATYNAAAGGSNTHTHGAGNYAGPGHTHPAGTLQTNDDAWPYGGGGGEPVMSGWTTQGPHAVSGSTASGGTGAVTGTSTSADSRPAFATVVLCKKD